MLSVEGELGDEWASEKWEEDDESIVKKLRGFYKREDNVNSTNEVSLSKFAKPSPKGWRVVVSPSHSAEY